MRSPSSPLSPCRGGSYDGLRWMQPFRGTSPWRSDMTRESVLVRAMVELADNLVDDYDVVDVLTTLSDRCVDVLDIAAAGIMVATPQGQLQAVTSSNEAMRVVE